MPSLALADCKKNQVDQEDDPVLLTRLIAQVPGMLYQYRLYPDGRTTCPYVSRSVRDICGLEPKDLLEDASPWADLIHPEDRHRVWQSVLDSADTLKRWQQEYRVVLPDVGLRWVMGDSMPERLEDGSTLWHGYIRDITDHRKMQASIEDKERLLSLFIENAPVAINMFDKEMRCISVSKRFLENFGLTAEAVIGRSHYEVFPDFPEHLRSSHRRCLAGDTIRCDEEQYFRKDKNGNPVWGRWEITPWYSGNSIGGLLLFTEFITERKKAEQRERRLMNSYRALSAVNEAIIHADSESELCSSVSRIAVEYGGMAHAWIGRPDSDGRIHSYAWFGAFKDFENSIVIHSIAGALEGRGPSGTAYRESRPIIVNDALNDDIVAPWHAQLRNSGVNAVASYPIQRGGKPFAVFTQYSVQTGAFDDEIAALLQDMAKNISFALDNFDREANLAKLSAQLIETQERERKNLAVELHDEMGQRLTALNLSLHQMRHSVADRQGQSALRHATEEVSSLMQKVHSISCSLRPPTLDRIGLESATQHLLMQHFANTNIKYVFEYAGLPKKLPGPVEITVYRVVQEAITNIVRHAEATYVIVEINGGDNGDEIEIVIRDNGNGFSAIDSKSKPDRIGLLGMRERVQLLGGSLVIESVCGMGTRIKAMMPIHSQPIKSDRWED